MIIQKTLADVELSTCDRKKLRTKKLPRKSEKIVPPPHAKHETVKGCGRRNADL